MVTPLAKKSLGQNYLVDVNLQKKIVEAAAPSKNDFIVEIGPGPGALTSHLLQSEAQISVVEKDERFLQNLEQMAADSGHKITLHHTDALKVDFTKISPKGAKIIGNLPYNVGTQILFNLLQNAPHFSSFTFMLQKEVVHRITAQKGDKDWGRLAVWCDLLCKRQKLFDVPGTAFRPQPRVISSVVQLTPLPHPRFKVNTQALEDLLRAAFGQRRKMLRASLKGLLTPQQIEEAGINPQARPETLNTEELCRLANTLHKFK